MITIDTASLHDFDTELWRLIYTANTIAVSPTLIQKFPVFSNQKQFEQYINFPKLDAFASSEFWQKVKVTEFDAPVSVTRLKQFTKYFSSKDLTFIGQSMLSRTAQLTLATRLRGYIEMVLEYLDMQFKVLQKASFQKITLQVTKFGTDGSYYRNSDGSIYLVYRVDAPVSTIADMIFQIYLRELLHPEGIGDDEVFARSGEWEKILSISEFLIKYGSHELMLDDDLHLRPQKTTSDFHESQEYLDSLGITLRTPLTSVEGKIYYQNQLCFQFSPQEELVLHELIRNRNTFVSSYEIATLVWGNSLESKYSYAYIPKLLWGVNSKLKKLDDNAIQLISRRNLGYMLKM